MDKIAIITGKLVLSVSKLWGGGSALPGLIAEKISPQFSVNVLHKLPYGIVAVSGTNGKTTTAKIITELLEESGLNVVANRSGSNFSRGVTSELLKSISWLGKSKSHIAVLELDEAHGAKFAKTLKPNHVVLLNISEDQTDRFENLEKVKSLLETIAKSAKESVILNADDDLVASIASNIESRFIKFFSSKALNHQASLVTHDYNPQKTIFQINNQNFHTNPQLPGRHNSQNIAAAIALCLVVLKDKASHELLAKTINKIVPAKGRGEAISINGAVLELILIKNRASFQANLDVFVTKPASTMIAINDNYADGRDISWLESVDYHNLKKSNVEMISGNRAEYMAEVLNKHGIESAQVDLNLSSAVETFLSNNQNKPLRIFSSYTALSKIRTILSKYQKS